MGNASTEFLLPISFYKFIASWTDNIQIMLGRGSLLVEKSLASHWGTDENIRPLRPPRHRPHKGLNSSSVDYKRIEGGYTYHQEYS